VKVEKNDIIILSSDGLWDVIKADQLQKIIEHNGNKVKVLY
jgi:serine/threonine protein phosphatase PrpC